MSHLILPPDWVAFLPEWATHPDNQRLADFLKHQYATKTIYPPAPNLFQALKLTAPDNVKVVILGQDPYHGDNQATGFAFSVPKGQRLPPSLRNIYKELNTDLNCDIPQNANGDLTPWAKRGVLLLNNTLSVEAGLAGSHRGHGWESLTNLIIKKLSLEKEGLVFILWGTDAKRKKSLIDSQKHFIIESAHPSPLSSYRGFFGSKPFSQANNYLTSIGSEPIAWCEVFKE